MNSEIKHFIIESIKKGSVNLYIQPFMKLDTNTVCGGEILSRMQGPSDGMIMPDVFIKVIEENDMQSEFDMMIFSKACAWVQERLQNGMKDKVITCNFFKTTIANDSFVNNILGISQGYGIEPNVMGIEVLESDDLIGNPKLAENLNALHKLGFKILLDDWGRGYTSYDDLHNIQVDVLKLDKSIMKNIETEKGKKIFESIVSLARELGIQVLCEGLERQMQRNLAKHYGCDIGQGYGLYIPNELSKYNSLLEGRQALATI